MREVFQYNRVLHMHCLLPNNDGFKGKLRKKKNYIFVLMYKYGWLHVY